MSSDDIKQAQLKLLCEAENCYLATISGDGFPYIRSLFNLRNEKEFPLLVDVFKNHDNDFLVYLSTNTSSLKIDQIKINPKCSIYYCNPKEIHGLMLTGKIEIVADPQVHKMLWQDGWEIYYPSGPTDPDFTVLRLRPKSARGWYKGAKFEFKLD